MSLSRFPLEHLHQELGAEFGEFAGWRAPINYGSVLDEHLAVRSSAGVFDLSHMGRIVVEGSGATKLLDHLVPRIIESKPGWMLGPTAFLNENAGFRDDVMLYKLSDETWMIVPNAVNRQKVFDWLTEWASRLGLTVKISDKTFDWVLLALQGPKAAQLMASIGAGSDILDLKLLQFRQNIVFEKIGARAVLVSRSGWTGEDGFELIAEASEAEKILRALIEAGAKPCGLAARDSLRIEVGFVLYGHEIDEETTPVDARYWWVYQPGPKNECIGCKALREALRRGATKVRVGLKLSKKARVVPRQGDKIYVDDVEIGYVTSGAYSPILKRSIAQAYVKPSHALIGLSVEVERRGKRYSAKVVDFPLVTPSSKPPT